MSNTDVLLKPYHVTFHLTPDQEEGLQKLTLAWNKLNGRERTEAEMFDFVMTVGSTFDISKKMRLFEDFIERNKKAPQA